MSRIFRILSATGLLAVGAVAVAGAGAAQEARADCPPPDAADYYFPEGTFGPTLDVEPDWNEDVFRREWYSRHLASMPAPSLSCGPAPAAEVYRFTWLRSFNAPIAVLISRSRGGYQASATILSGAGGYDPGVPELKVRRRLELADWQRLQAALGKADFWAEPTIPPPVECRSAAGDECIVVGADGAQWIVEAQRGEAYHVVDRWSADGAYRELGLTFLDLAGLPEPDWIY